MSLQLQFVADCILMKIIIQLCKVKFFVYYVVRKREREDFIFTCLTSTLKKMYINHGSEL